MNPNQSAAFKVLEQAQQALKAGDKNTAHQFAAQAAQLAPELEEVWLMMGALASPHGSVAYLEKAVQINPQSERAQKGLTWARARLQKEADAPILAIPRVEEKTPDESPQPVIEETQPGPVPALMAQPLPDSNDKTIVAAAVEPKTQPRKQPALVSQPDQPVAGTQPAAVPKTVQIKKTAANPRRPIYLALLFILLCLLAVWAAWQYVSSAAAFSTGVSTGAEHGPSYALVNAAQPQATQISPEITAAPAEPTSRLATNTAEISIPATVSSTPDPVETTTSAPQPSQIVFVASATVPPPAATVFVPSATLSAPTDAPTNPAPTDAGIPTFTPEPATATQELASNEPPSPTPLPTDTGPVLPTQYAGATPAPGTANAGTNGHWIDVDLTNQMIYAYDGTTLVNSFLVSTGTWEHATVTGQYYVYVKYRYTDMSGPGYYLPNVPYTMYFYKGYAVHGTYWHSNFGTPMSHGCVNLSIPDAEWVYNFSTIGTLVNVHY